MLNTIYHSIALYSSELKHKDVVVIVISNLFTDALCNSQHTASNDRDDSEF
jgi:hypothetical protein